MVSYPCVKRIVEGDKAAGTARSISLGNVFLQRATLVFSHCHSGDASRVKARLRFNIPADYEPVAAIAIGYLGNPQTLPEPLQQQESTSKTRKENWLSCWRIYE